MLLHAHHFEFSSDELLPPVTFIEETTNHMNLDESIEIPRSDIPDADILPQSFTTNIDELNLLGENREGEVFVYNRTGDRTGGCEFRIDNLSLWFLTFPFFFRRVRIVGKEYIFLSRDWLYPKIIDDLNKE